jgi:1-acyl-sn-glycerol-3-phosphate acyltransferase
MLAVFAIVYILVYPIYLWSIFVERHQMLGLRINYYVARLYFWLVFLPIDIVWEFKPDKHQQYIFCANHFSMFDIPLMALSKVPFVFVGKSSIAKIPLFGFMFKKLHIMVNRNSLKSKHEVYMRSSMALDEGKSLMIFPEGGIVSSKSHKMGPFKEGAFRIAIEKQVPIVPVTLHDIWLFMPDEKIWELNYRRMTMVFHKPVETKDKTMEDLESVKQQVFKTISKELQEREYVDY